MECRFSVEKVKGQGHIMENLQNPVSCLLTGGSAGRSSADCKLDGNRRKIDECLAGLRERTRGKGEEGEWKEWENWGSEMGRIRREEKGRGRLNHSCEILHTLLTETSTVMNCDTGATNAFSYPMMIITQLCLQTIT